MLIYFHVKNIFKKYIIPQYQIHYKKLKMLNNSLYIYLHFIVNSQNKIIIFLFESKFIELGFRNKNIFFMDLLVIRGDIYIYIYIQNTK